MNVPSTLLYLLLRVNMRYSSPSRSLGFEAESLEVCGAQTVFFHRFCFGDLGKQLEVSEW